MTDEPNAEGAPPPPPETPDSSTAASEPSPPAAPEGAAPQDGGEGARSEEIARDFAAGLKSEAAVTEGAERNLWGARLKGWLDALKRKPKALRVLLFPVEFVVWLLWFVVQLLFALDAVLIVAAAVGTLVLVARILKPELFEGVLPEILK